MCVSLHRCIDEASADDRLQRDNNIAEVQTAGSATTPPIYLYERTEMNRTKRMKWMHKYYRMHVPYLSYRMPANGQEPEQKRHKHKFIDMIFPKDRH